MDSKEILKLNLLKYLIEHFDITKVEELNSRLDVYFEEKNDYGNQLTDKGLFISKTEQKSPILSNRAFFMWCLAI